MKPLNYGLSDFRVTPAVVAYYTGWYDIYWMVRSLPEVDLLEYP